jgi:putative effector of murein hydrolase LrgA (UPF0299 family)
MRRLLGQVLQHPGRILGLALLVLLVFVLTTASAVPAGLSIDSLCQSLDTTLTLLLAIDSPTKMLENRSAFVVGFGWLVCLMGWLFLPLLIGVLVDISLSRVESYSKLRLMFRELGLSAKLDNENLEKFTDEMMEKVARIVAGRDG